MPLDIKCPLTKRQLEVLRLFASGFNTGEIADMLFISPHTARTHRNNIVKKVHCRKIAAAVHLAQLEKWI